MVRRARLPLLYCAWTYILIKRLYRTSSTNLFTRGNDHVSRRDRVLVVFPKVPCPDRQGSL